MPVFDFSAVSPDPHLYWQITKCSFCQSPMTELASEYDGVSGYDHWAISFFYCSKCGWRIVQKIEDTFDSYSDDSLLYIASSCLANLDLNDVQTPIQEIKRYLCAKYSDRYNVHPRLFEEVVASVFRGSGYTATVTNYSGDDGIDVFLEKGRERIGVQVKRYKNSISVEQIRSLAGALLLNDVTKGIFVTTSNFQRGVEDTVHRYSKRGYIIELYDGNRFLDALQISIKSERPDYKDQDFQFLLNNLQYSGVHSVPYGN